MANFNLNKVILGGRVTTDVELRTTPSGIPVTSFQIAVNKRGAKQGDEAKSDFFSCVAWRGTAEFFTRYFHKGSAVCVIGTIENNNWTDEKGVNHYGDRVTAEEVYFVESKSDSVGGAAIVPKPEPTVYKSPAMEQGGYGALQPLADDAEFPF